MQGKCFLSFSSFSGCLHDFHLLIVEKCAQVECVLQVNLMWSFEQSPVVLTLLDKMLASRSQPLLFFSRPAGGDIDVASAAVPLWGSKGLPPTRVSILLFTSASRVMPFSA